MGNELIRFTYKMNSFSRSNYWCAGIYSRMYSTYLLIFDLKVYGIQPRVNSCFIMLYALLLLNVCISTVINNRMHTDTIVYRPLILLWLILNITILCVITNYAGKNVLIFQNFCLILWFTPVNNEIC